MLQLSNPRDEATVEDWPSGKRRVTAIFALETNRRGVRCNRVTTGKPKATTYYRRMVICDGDDGRIYLAAITDYGQYVLIPGTLKTTEYFYERENVEMCEQIRRLFNVTS